MESEYYDYEYSGHVEMCEECFNNIEDCGCDDD